jgi:hypothetical protein
MSAVITWPSSEGVAPPVGLPPRNEQPGTDGLITVRERPLPGAEPAWTD